MRDQSLFPDEHNDVIYMKDQFLTRKNGQQSATWGNPKTQTFISVTKPARHPRQGEGGHQWKKKISQTCPMYLTTLLLAPGLWQWPEQTAVGREGRRLITRRIQVPAETRGKCKWARAQRWGEEKNTQAPNLTGILRKITTNLITVLMPGEEKD